MSAKWDLGALYGTHAGVLERELSKLPPGSLVIEHGVGVYSSPLIARHDVRVLIVEPLPGWAGWARWLYQKAGRTVEAVGRSKETLARLSDVALVFIDGPARDRGPLLGWALERGAPIIVAHDTEEDTLDWYLYRREHFKAAGYDVEHDGDRPRTTVWRKRA